jgi:hypothetical protein
MKKNLLIKTVVGLMIVLMIVAFVLAAKPGKYDDGNFAFPDYANGASESFNLGESRAFNYNCHCANQPGTANCYGTINLQVDSGSGFVNEKSTACNIGELQTCSSNYAKTFNTAGVYNFRVFCDENSGTDFTQPSNEYVTVTVFSGCTNGETRLCPLQVGVCEGSFETCNSGLWSGCNYATIPGYEADEATCDELDNDCNGLVDDVDADGDGVSLCGGIGVVNELLIVGLNNNPANIDVLYYNIINNAYESIWSTTTSGISSNTPGGEIGDVTHDGINDFVISRNDGTLNTLEVWSYNQASVEWSRVWKGNIGGSSLAERIFIGDIDDFDNDGFNEILVTNGETEELELYGTDSYVLTSFAKQHSVKMCSGSAADYIATGADMNNNGVPEIVFQCGIGDNLEIFEWNGASFVLKAALPQSMFIDDAESGDVNQDGIDDVVFCGNDMRSHVLTYSDGNYVVGYATPKSSSFIQSCSVGDVTNDGHSDWFDVSQDGARVFSFNGNNYINTWSSSPETYIGAIGASFVGDCDNDGFTEFLHGPLSSPYNIKLWENDVVGATSFSNTFTFDNTDLFPTIVIGNLNPYNDDLGVDCNDYNASIHPGATEICAMTRLMRIAVALKTPLSFAHCRKVFVRMHSRYVLADLGVNVIMAFIMS